MIDITSLESLQKEIRACVESDRATLDELRKDVRSLKSRIRRIQPHSTAAISLVATDGGDNKIRFDPLMVQVVRVVDSSNNEYVLEALTPRTPIQALDQRHLDESGRGKSALGRMMERLHQKSLYDLSIISRTKSELSPSWVQVYRELTEWAVLLELLEGREFATDTLIICDGFLRSKVFAGELFREFRGLVEAAIARHYTTRRRRIYVAGIAKHSRVLQTYQLAMALEGVLRSAYPAFVEVPRALEEKVYKWSEYARGDDRTVEGGEVNKYVAGKMFFVKFGSAPHDPIWPIDILESQVDEAEAVFGYMLNDALDGFPIPFYPGSLQRAHEHAALVDFDMEILEDGVVSALRDSLGEHRWVVDDLRLQVVDVAGRRYE